MIGYIGMMLSPGPPTRPIALGPIVSIGHYWSVDA